ncbi:MAG: hypothetical protein LBT54_08040 [Bifidobacteriaceae bacterium]|jgi:hypothetical protein|nr:hypothetical protein [Bifidobacteriaceae bacterium]
MTQDNAASPSGPGPDAANPYGPPAGGPAAYGPPGGPPGYGPPAAYGQPPGAYPNQYGGQYAPAATQNNSYGVLALVFGIGSWVLAPFLAAIPAVILGVMSRRAADGGTADNRSLGSWGFGLGLANLILSVLLGIVLVVLVVIGIQVSER